MPNLNISLTQEELEEFKEKKRKLQVEMNRDLSWKQVVSIGLQK
jgi:hypothetical protein